MRSQVFIFTLIIGVLPACSGKKNDSPATSSTQKNVKSAEIVKEETEVVNLTTQVNENTQNIASLNSKIDNLNETTIADSKETQEKVEVLFGADKRKIALEGLKKAEDINEKINFARSYFQSFEYTEKGSIIDLLSHDILEVKLGKKWSEASFSSKAEMLNLYALASEMDSVKINDTDGDTFYSLAMSYLKDPESQNQANAEAMYNIVNIRFRRLAVTALGYFKDVNKPGIFLLDESLFKWTPRFSGIDYPEEKKTKLGALLKKGKEKLASVLKPNSSNTDILLSIDELSKVNKLLLDTIKVGNDLRSLEFKAILDKKVVKAFEMMNLEEALNAFEEIKQDNEADRLYQLNKLNSLKSAIGDFI